MATDDLELFLQEMADVKPLKADVLSDENGEHAPTLAQLARRKAAELEPEYDANYLSMEYVDLVAPDQILAYKKDGVQEGVYKNLRLGKYQVDATLMLLGKNLTEARRALFEFVADCHLRGIRTLLLHHGMGRDSKPHPAILKSYCFKWLQQIPEVLACHSAQKFMAAQPPLMCCYKKLRAKKENRERHQKR